MVHKESGVLTLSPFKSFVSILLYFVTESFAKIYPSGSQKSMDIMQVNLAYFETVMT